MIEDIASAALSLLAQAAPTTTAAPGGQPLQPAPSFVQALVQMAPFILIVGEEDMNNNAVSFRFRDGSQLNGVPVDEAKANILTVIKKRVQVNTADDFKAALAD